MNKLTSVPGGNSHPRIKMEKDKPSLQELSRLKEELEYSDVESRKKMKGLNDNLRKLEGSLIEEGQVRTQKGIQRWYSD